MTHDPRFVTHQTAEQRELALSQTGEPPGLAAIREGRLFGAKVLAVPKPQPKRQLEKKPKVMAHEAERAALLATQADLRKRIAAQRATESARAELEPLREQKAELTEQLTKLQVELDRRGKGGLQSKIRAGEFARGGFRVPLATALTGKRPEQAKPKSERKRLGFASTIGRSFAKRQKVQ